MPYTLNNLAPNEDTFEDLYSQSESYLIAETLPDENVSEMIGTPDRKEWLRKQTFNRPYQLQVLKDDKVIVWVAGVESDGFVDYHVALIGPDLDGSRAYWYDADFWDSVKQFHRSQGLSGFLVSTLRNTSLHETITASVSGKPEAQQNLVNTEGMDFVNIKWNVD